MIIMLGSQKGGCGKSTLAINISSYLAKAGEDVVLVDADSQNTSARWAGDRACIPELPPVHCVEKRENIKATLEDLDTRYGYVVVDTAGRDSRELRTGMIAAHLLLVPFIPSQADLDTLPYLQEVITQARDLNPELIVRAVLSRAPTNPAIREVEEARDYLADFPDISPLRSIVRDRKIYRDLLAEGIGVVEQKNNLKAAAEIQLLMQEVIEVVGRG